jgi:regulator of protease activity HflC (stomatin/prohibitin superfamily)
MTNIRTVMGSMDLDELLSHRETINAKLLSVVDEATNPWGTKVTRIEIKDIRPPKDLVDSMARQMKAEREKRALILEAEGERQAAILEAEGEKQSRILKAEGVKQSMILEADGRRESAQRDAEARERLALAEARAVHEVSQAVGTGSAQAVNYFVAQKYVEAFKALAESSNQKLVLMPMEATSLVSTISGISEVVKDAFGEKKGHEMTDRKLESKPKKTSIIPDAK